MTSALITRALALLASGVLVLAACAPAATSAPTTAAQATSGPAPTDGLFPSFDLGSFALPSFNSDLELEELLPDDIGGEAVQKVSMTGDSFLGGGGSDDMEAVLSQFGKAPADLSVAFGGAAGVNVIAYRIRGVPAGQTYEAFLGIVEMEENPTISDTTVGGKPVKMIVTSSETSYIYASGDVLFTVVGNDGVPQALIDETFSKLP